jgi:diguanylate cyclase (GGDEF)-like protein
MVAMGLINRDEMKKRLTWLVKMRWGGILSVLITTHVLREIAVMSFSLVPVYVILGTAALCNLTYQWRLKSPRENLEYHALIQIILDQLLLALAVYFSGGCDSPFIYFFIFHVVISGIILPWWYSFAFAGTAVFLPALVLGLKHLGILPHVGIFRNEPMIFVDSTVIAAYGIAFISTVFLTAYFVTYLSRQLYEKNEEVMRLYTLSERLRSSIQLPEVMGIIEQELRGVVGATSSIYLPLNKENKSLSLAIGEETLSIPLVDKNSFADAVLRNVPLVLDRRVIESEYEIKALDLLGAKRAMVLPVLAATFQPCYEYFNCIDHECRAYKNKEEGSCWQLSGTHCKGQYMGNAVDKLASCIACELFTPVGVYLLSLPKEYLPLLDVNMEASMRLLNAAGMAVSNALLHDKITLLSKTDGLTGLRNHREFKETLQSEILRSKWRQRGFSILMIDVDHFKHYNDTNGHPQGDIVLKKMANLIKDSFKETDCVARYGGEEFIVILMETGDREQAIEAAERLRKKVETHKFPKEDTQPGGKLTISIGVSFYPKNGLTQQEIVKAADDALYVAKKEGRNKVVAAS